MWRHQAALYRMYRLAVARGVLRTRQMGGAVCLAGLGQAIQSWPTLPAIGVRKAVGGVLLPVECARLVAINSVWHV